MLAIFIADQKTIIFLRGIKDWGFMAFEATLKKHELSVYYCYPPLLFALMSFLAMPKNSLAVLSPSIKYRIHGLISARAYFQNCKEICA